MSGGSLSSVVFLLPKAGISGLTPESAAALQAFGVAAAAQRLGLDSCVASHLAGARLELSSCLEPLHGPAHIMHVFCRACQVLLAVYQGEIVHAVYASLPLLRHLALKMLWRALGGAGQPMAGNLRSSSLGAQGSAGAFRQDQQFSFAEALAKGATNAPPFPPTPDVLPLLAPGALSFIPPPAGCAAARMVCMLRTRHSLWSRHSSTLHAHAAALRRQPGVLLQQQHLAVQRRRAHALAARRLGAAVGPGGSPLLP